MKKNHLATTVTLAFFACTFLLAFTSQDSDVAAFRILSCIGLGCVLSVLTIYWDRLPGANTAKATSKYDAVLNDAQKFSQEYGEVYVLADKMKQQRKLKKQLSVKAS
ncbi:hypothetical protein [Rufibacter sp. LB8]|uniref:hypothetical protein n=1 Tax=Rufibacter sp. LB8 TaxID=2777781 RepID=UPI00178C4C58|nr:hypothetical protein [Rufibacter sp. LB8]